MAFVVWGLLACSGGYWLIQIMAKPLAAPADALPAAEQRGPQADLSRLFGAATLAAAEPVAAAEGRFKLLGVVAPKRPAAGQPGQASEGVALIAVDGVARTVRIGASVDGELQLLALTSRSASLGQGGVVSLTLELAAPAPASTGALAPAPLSTTVLGGVMPIPAPPQATPPAPGVLPQQGGPGQPPSATH